jgi:hypothetical protein|tara:strand:+ start:345 stop:920 length:576 start_codon:yes stop_codon:yes gene_type:complete
MFWVYDNLLRDSVAEDIYDRMRMLSWQYNYNSLSNSKGGIQPHWHIHCGANHATSCEDEILGNNYEYLLPVFEEAKLKFKTPVKLLRAYMNAHTNGVEPHMHQDKGDYTFIYYPRLDWKSEWLGGTAIWDKEAVNIVKYCNYVGNRLLVFDSCNNHQAMPVSKFCHELRPVIVFKTMRDEELLLQRLKDSL